MTQRKRYSTGFQIAYAAKALPKEEYMKVPKATGNGFRNRNFEELIGYADFDTTLDHMQLMAQYKRITGAFVSLLRAFVMLQQVYNEIPDRRQAFENNKQVLTSIIVRLSYYFPRKKVLRILGVSYYNFKLWSYDTYCRFSVIKSCRKKYSNQLSNRELKLIRQFVTHPVYCTWSLSSIYLKLLRNTTIYLGRNTFYKYVKIHEWYKARKRPKFTKKYAGLKAQYPYEILHMDVSELNVGKGVKLYFHFIIDNFSRSLLSLRVGRKKDAMLARDNLKDLADHFDDIGIRTNFTMITDDGSENKSHTKELMNELNVEHKIARIHIIQSNSMVESVIRNFKNSFLYHIEFKEEVQYQRRVEKAKMCYNTELPMDVLKGQTPMEALKGSSNPFLKVKERVCDALTVRIGLNKYGDCW